MELVKINEMLDLVNDAINKTNDVRGDSIFEGDNRAQLQAITRVFNRLEGVQSSMMLARDNVILENMEEVSKNLKGINSQLKKDIKDLKKVAKDVAAVAVAVGVIVDIITKVISILV